MGQILLYWNMVLINYRFLDVNKEIGQVIKNSLTQYFSLGVVGNLIFAKACMAVD